MLFYWTDWSDNPELGILKFVTLTLISIWTYHERPVGYNMEKEEKYGIGEPVRLGSKPSPVYRGGALCQVLYNGITSTNTRIQ